MFTKTWIWDERGPRVGNSNIVAARNKGQVRCPAAAVSVCVPKSFLWQFCECLFCVSAVLAKSVLTQPTFFGSGTLPAASSCLHDFRLRTAQKIGVLCASTRIEFFRTVFWGGWLGRKWSWHGGGPEEKNTSQSRNQEGRIVADLQRFNSKLVRLEAVKASVKKDAFEQVSIPNWFD